MGGYRIKPGKGISALAALVGLGMGIFGLLVLLPMFGSAPGAFGGMGSAFVILWVLVAFGIAAFYGYNALSDRGVSFLDIDVPGPPAGHAGPGQPPGSDFEERLRKLDALRRDGLITDAEYQEKRATILTERW